GVRSDQPTPPAHVDDDVVAEIYSPVVRQRDQVCERRAVRFFWWVDLQHQLARLVEVLLQRVNLRRKKIGPGPGHDDQSRIVGYRTLLRDDQFVDRVILAAERGGDGAVAFAFRRSGVALAMALGEVDFLL